MLDTRLEQLLKLCKIWMPGEVQEVEGAAEEWGLPLVLSAMKRLSIIPKVKGKYPIGQFRNVLSQKVREKRQRELAGFRR